MFGFEEEAVHREAELPTCGAVESPPASWIDRAVDACFSSQKTRWRALTGTQRDRVARAMWAYATARGRARANPLPAVAAEDALRGWIVASPLSCELRILHQHLVSPADIPESEMIAS